MNLHCVIAQGVPGHSTELAFTYTAAPHPCHSPPSGKYDDLPEMAFYMVGDIKEVQEKADRMAKEMAERKDSAAGKASGGC